MTDIRDWADDADLNGEASPAGWPEGMPPSDVNNSAREMMAALRRSYVRQPWYAPGGEIVRVSGTQITIRDDTKVTDYSQFYTVGQRFRVEGVEYNTTGFISSVSYEAPTTTIGFEADAETPLPGTIKEVYVGLNYQDVQGVAGPNLLGCIIGFTDDASKLGAGLLHANGEKFSPSLYPDLAELYLIGTESDGSPKYRYGREKVGDEWWPKRPDVRGYFPRFLDNREAPAEGEDDTRVDLGAPRTVGSIQGDDNKEHNHSIKVYTGQENTKNPVGTYMPGYNFAASAQRGLWQTQTNALNEVAIATQGSETRPKNIAVVGVIVAYGGVVAGGLADISEVLDDVKTTKELAESLSSVIENLGSVMRYCGSVATYDDLPTVDNQVGDVYNVLDTGANYAWTAAGTWDEFGNMSAEWGSIGGDITAQADLQEALSKKLENTATGANSFAIGGNNIASGSSSIALGKNAQVRANNAIQIGAGTNSVAGTVQIRTGVGVVRLLENTGKLSSEVLPDDIGDEGYRSLNETQKTEVLREGTYEGVAIEDGEVFTEYDGKFVKAKAGAVAVLESFTYPYHIGGVFGHGGRLVTMPKSSAQQAAYSDDHGVTWTTFNEPFTRVRGWLHNGTYWLGLIQGDYGTVQCEVSVDGITWSSYVTIASGDRLYSYGVLNGVFYVCTVNSDYTSSEYYYSENGTSWTKGTKPANDFKIVCRKNDIVLLSRDGRVFVSTDGQTWEDTGVSHGLSSSSGWDTSKLSCLFEKVYFTWSGNTVSSKDLSSWSSDAALPNYFLEVSDSFAIGVNDTSSISSFLTTTDGEFWTSVSLPGSMPDFYTLATTGDGYFYLFDEDVTRGYKASYQKIALESLSYNKAEVDAIAGECMSLQGTTAPDTTTVGSIGQFYVDTTTGTGYMCVGVSGSTYTWKQITV